MAKLKSLFRANYLISTNILSFLSNTIDIQSLLISRLINKELVTHVTCIQKQIKDLIIFKNLRTLTINITNDYGYIRDYGYKLYYLQLLSSLKELTIINPIAPKRVEILLTNITNLKLTKLYLGKDIYLCQESWHEVAMIYGLITSAEDYTKQITDILTLKDLHIESEQICLYTLRHMQFAKLSLPRYSRTHIIDYFRDNLPEVIYAFEDYYVLC